MVLTTSYELGMSAYQQEQVGVLVHVLYSNPKVLYSPNNTAADKIIEKANETFELLDMVTQYARKMLNISEEIKAFLAQNSTEHSLSVLQKIRKNLRKHPLLLKVLNSIALQQFAEGSVIVDKDVFLQQLDTIDNAACSWISLMSGLNLNMFQGFQNEDDLMSYVHKDAFFENVTVLASKLCFFE
ncbi:ATP-binding cassette sub-family A member 2-like [Centruroides sculpturatus]|uniref:ATP-binding cassette sub-family A member 2-like n=1 Tax=Centruroides sculpturatus TaxID=218467 RepID=UPI000C6D962D|nr:ATP-binding cassette sub-family A member 2-like [Centruroides sculpturatus]